MAKRDAVEPAADLDDGPDVFRSQRSASRQRPRDRRTARRRRSAWPPADPGAPGARAVRAPGSRYTLLSGNAQRLTARGQHLKLRTDGDSSAAKPKHRRRRVRSYRGSGEGTAPAPHRASRRARRPPEGGFNGGRHGVGDERTVAQGRKADEPDPVGPAGKQPGATSSTVQVFPMPPMPVTITAGRRAPEPRCRRLPDAGRRTRSGATGRLVGDFGGGVGRSPAVLPGGGLELLAGGV